MSCPWSGGVGRRLPPPSLPQLHLSNLASHLCTSSATICVAGRLSCCRTGQMRNPLSLKYRTSIILPKCQMPSAVSSHLSSHPYTVQLVPLDWLKTSSYSSVFLLPPPTTSYRRGFPGGPVCPDTPTAQPLCRSSVQRSVPAACSQRTRSRILGLVSGRVPHHGSRISPNGAIYVPQCVCVYSGLRS